MNLTATFLAQLAAFFIFAWMMAKLVWPPMMKALDERAEKVRAGLAAADKAKQIAAVGLVASVADIDVFAAWIYAERLAPELGVACAVQLLRRKDPSDSPHGVEGRKARVALSSRVRRL